MKSKTKTIGNAIEKLVKEYGTTTQGIYILQRALENATGALSITFSISNGPGSVLDRKVTLGDTPGYKKAGLAERKELGRLGIIFYAMTDYASFMWRYTPEGNAEAIDFPVGTEEDDMRFIASEAREGAWKPFNYTTRVLINEFNQSN